MPIFQYRGGRRARNEARLTHNYWSEVVNGIDPKSAEATIRRNACRDYIEWCVMQLCNGRRVELHGLGTIWMTLRKGRDIPDHKRPGQIIHQQAQYVLKLSASPGLRQRMRDLAKLYPMAKDLPGNRGNSLNYGRTREQRSGEAAPDPRKSRHKERYIAEPVGDLMEGLTETAVSSLPSTPDGPDPSPKPSKGSSDHPPESKPSPASDTHNPPLRPARADKLGLSDRTPDISDSPATDSARSDADSSPPDADFAGVDGD